jgi:hypothetical protein
LPHIPYLALTPFFSLNPDYADGIYNKGDILVSLGRLEEAIAVMSIAIQKRPGWPLYYCNRGKQYIALGMQKEVRDKF